MPRISSFGCWIKLRRMTLDLTQRDLGAQGQPALAAQLFGAAEALHEVLGFPAPPLAQAVNARNLAAPAFVLKGLAFHLPPMNSTCDQRGKPMAEQIISPAELNAAIDENIAASWRTMGLMPGAELRETPEMIWVVTGVPIPSFNGVVCARLDSAGAAAAVAEALEAFRRRGVPMMWLVGPTSQPADLGALLVEHGLEHIGDEPGMAIDLDLLRDEPPAPEGLVVERVDDEAALRDWCGFAGDPVMIQRLFDWLRAAALGSDRTMVNYLGRLAGRPVATASLVLAAGVAGIYNVGTLPEAQRRGIGTHMTREALRDARASGYRVGVLHSSKMGVEVYRRLGFHEVCTISLYVAR
jgi:ribosomal protein S18 acetylase RimI-like enzyme